MENELKIAGVLGIVLLLVVGGLIVFNFSGEEAVESRLNKFSSDRELRVFLKENTQQNYFFGGFAGATLREGTAVVESFAASDSSGADLRADSYSLTNVQVKGVDEIDVVKNDGKYIYYALDNKVKIVDAFPASEMKLVSELEFDNPIAGIFIYEDKLIVLETVYGPYYYGGSGVVTDAVVGAASSRYVEQKPETKVKVFDVSDKENPVLTETFVSEGSFYTARMIGEQIYVISNKYANPNNPELPVFRSDGKELRVSSSDIYYPSVIEPSFTFTSVMAVDVGEMDFSGDVYLTGTGGMIYVSRDNIYLTNGKYADWNKIQEDAIREVYFELFSPDDRRKAAEILDSDEERYIKIRDIGEIFEKYFNSLSAGEKERLNEELQEKLEDFYSDWAKKNEKTVVHKIEIDGLDISYAGSGEVPGYVLNQFSMDENNGFLRIATTTGNNWFLGNSGSANHLYVLDDKLKIVGSVEDLASGERIYSVRYLGDKAYMVTFRQVDPLFVIGLENPEKPKVLGYLKVTGFSSYLQLLDENTLIGIGREASEEGRVQGLKISLFDVSDFENPLETDKYIVSVENGMSYSEAEYDHKAVLLDRDKRILAIPVTYYGVDFTNGEYLYDNWMGAYVFEIDETKIDLKGKISHGEKEQKEVYNWNSYVKRILYMDDVLYTVSPIKVKANNLDDLSEINFINLPFENPVLFY